MARITFYGRLADFMGRERTVAIAQPITAHSLITRLAGDDTELAAVFANARVQLAVNEVIVTPDFIVKDGDEIAFLPPFSGG